MARKKYNVQYPNLYKIALSEKDQKEADAFNSIQRAHQNTLVSYSILSFFIYYLLHDTNNNRNLMPLLCLICVSTD